LGNPTTDQKEAGLMQMRINTRLTALQAAQTIMSTPGYVDGGGKVDHITLLAMAGDIEKYIIDDLAVEAEKAITAAKNAVNVPRIHRP
jgi:hypothetical protein